MKRAVSSSSMPSGPPAETWDRDFRICLIQSSWLDLVGAAKCTRKWCVLSAKA